MELYLQETYDNLLHATNYKTRFVRKKAYFYISVSGLFVVCFYTSSQASHPIFKLAALLHSSKILHLIVKPALNRSPKGQRQPSVWTTDPKLEKPAEEYLIL
ncbi:hypothetical protein AMECASPLE_026329 [Ameca splendens]|uniref:Uncharacterized protein n=1 Tax=Ameca splendens TaxID=208324 RepID=A0ABV0XTZ8_9TELE